MWSIKEIKKPLAITIITIILFVSVHMYCDGYKNQDIQEKYIDQWDSGWEIYIIGDTTIVIPRYLGAISLNESQLRSSAMKWAVDHLEDWESMPIESILDNYMNHITQKVEVEPFMAYNRSGDMWGNGRWEETTYYNIHNLPNIDYLASDFCYTIEHSDDKTTISRNGIELMKVDGDAEIFFKGPALSIRYNDKILELGSIKYSTKAVNLIGMLSIFILTLALILGVIDIWIRTIRKKR